MRTDRQTDSSAVSKKETQFYKLRIETLQTENFPKVVIEGNIPGKLLFTNSLEIIFTNNLGENNSPKTTTPYPVTAPFLHNLELVLVHK